MKLFYVTIFVFLTMLSCTKKESIDTNSIGTLTKFKSSFKIRLDSVTSFRNTFYSVLTFDEKDYLAFVNSNDNSIRFYNLNTTAQEQVLHVPRLGEGGIPKIDGFSFINKDSIFIIGEFASDVCLYNLNGNLVKKYNFNPADNSSETLAGFGRRVVSTGKPAVFSNNQIYIIGFAEYPLMDPYYLFEKSWIEMRLDITNEIFEYIPIKFPPIYHGKLLNFNFSRDFNNTTNQLVHNFSSSDYVYTTNLNSMEKDSFLVKSRLIKEITSRQINDNMEKYLIETPFYYMILYDSYKELYYRVVYHGISHRNQDGSFNSYPDSKFSIIVASKEMRVLGEFPLEQYRYDMNTIIVAPNGLYISTANPKNPELNEDYLVFDRFTYETP